MQYKITSILFFLISVITYGQVNLAADTDKKEVNGKDVINLTVILEINGPELIQESSLKLPDLSKFNIVGSASERNTLLDPKTNVAINQLVYKIVLEPKQSGKIKIGSALVQVNGKMYKSEPFDVFVNDAIIADRNVGKTYEDVYLNMELQDTEVYKNQPTIAVLRAYSKDFNNLRKVGNVEFPKQDNVKIRPVSLEKSEIEQNGKSKVSSQVIAVVMIFPKESGKIAIKPASVSYKDSGTKIEKISSNKTSLHVKNLPSGSPVNFKNAVGNYHLTIEAPIKNARLEVNKPIDVLVKVTGEGNLTEALLPKILESASYTLYKPNFSEHVKNGNKGLKGVVDAHYIIVPKKPGDVLIRTEPFAYFDPSKQKYINLGTQTLALNVMTPEQISEAKTALEKVNEYTNNVLETVNTPILQTENLKVEPATHKISWKTLVSNYSVILAFMGLLAIGYTFYSKTKEKKLQPALKPLGSVSETEAKIREKMIAEQQMDFSQLNSLLDNEKYSAFFDEFETVNTAVENNIKQKFGTSVTNYIANSKGTSASENYRRLLQQMNMEKYAPVHSKEQLSEILDGFQTIWKDFV